jgi:transposase-like protein
VPYLTDIREVADEDEAREIARTLNLDRRHLTPQQRREVVAALRQEGHSLRAIAGATGVSQGQVRRDLSGVSQDTPATVTGRDGKSYPSKRPAAERVAQIQALADEGHTARQIGERLGVRGSAGEVAPTEPTGEEDSPPAPARAIPRAHE